MILFARLLLIIVVALLPPLAMQAINESALRSARQADIRAQVLREARAVSAELARISDGVRNTLVALAEVPALRLGEPVECLRLLRAVKDRFGFLRDMALIGPDGLPRCDTALAGARSRVAAPEVVLALARGDFVLGDYAVDAHGQPVLPMAYPLPASPGLVLVADFDLRWLREQILAHGLPPGSSATIADRDGRIMMRVPDIATAGTTMPQKFRWMLSETSPGVLEAPGLDGVRRIVGFVPPAAANDDLFVSIGFATDQAYSASEAAATRGYILFGCGLIVAVALAGWLLRGAITRPVGAILETTERWRAGDTSARVRLSDRGAEFQRIAEAINDLLDTIAADGAGLRARLAELDAVYRAAPVGLCFIDHDLRFLMSNDALNEINEIGDRDYRGCTVRELVPTIADRAEPLIRRALAGERIPPIEVTGVVPQGGDGTPRQLLVCYQPAVAADGHVLGAVVAVQDITALRKVETALADTLRSANAELEARVAERTAELQAEIAGREAMQEQLRQSQKMEMLGQLTGGIAHDFNNLLGALIGNLELAMKRAAAAPETLRLLRAALRAADRGAALTQRMLAFGRRQNLQLETVALAPLLEGMAELLASAIPPPVDVRIVAAPNMRPARADANQVELVILNLAVNARDAMPEGGTITISATEEVIAQAQPERGGLMPGHYVRITVHDPGIGMDAETLARAFEPFFTTKPVGQGSGLGLSMVQGVAEQSGGAATIESTPGLGTSVSVWLPMEVDDEPEAGNAPAEMANAAIEQG